MRPPARLLLTGAALLVATSCSNDAPVAPSKAVPVISGSPSLHDLAAPASYDFVIPAAGGEVSIQGMYTLTFPANAVCDPDAQDSKDGYAAEAWDAACTPASGDVAVQATLQWSSDRLWVDFTPAIRFVPSAAVAIHTDLFASIIRKHGASAVKSRAIKYAKSMEGTVIDDAKTDQSLKTRLDGQSGRISRRIKHFSGYMIATGEACEPSPDNSLCIWRQ